MSKYSAERAREAKYGIDPKRYEEMLIAQGYKCAICDTSHSEKPSKKWGRARLSVDHDHKTGAVRGLLCHRCNVAIGLFREDERIMYNAVRYLRENLGLF